MCLYSQHCRTNCCRRQRKNRAAPEQYVGAQNMKFDIYGKFQLLIRREEQKWRVYKIGNGLQMPVHDLIIPSEVLPEDLALFLDDFYHEAATPGTKVCEI